MSQSVSTLEELKKAAKEGVTEIVVADETLAKTVRVWHTLRQMANILVFLILGIGIFAWANPFQFAFLDSGAFRLARQILLGVGVLLLFAEYALPVVRLYKIGGADALGLKLVRRK